MKNLKTITGFLLLALLMSCGNGQKSTPSSSREMPAAVSNDNMSTDATDMSTTTSDRDSMDMDQSRSTDSLNRTGNKTDSIVGDTRMTKMFADLNLTEDQIKQFRLNAHKNIEAWRQNNGDATLSNEERMRQEAENVKSLLEPAQYEQYQQWVKDNPYDHR